ncbi:hypothetical protein [Reichenbachiella sp. MALMAid0571]|uniref:OB-fold protein n=1 Tax=Reichenbachiella sp. MALMAid0571 TaxID=3143939 RepID=UPI0032DEF1D8
MKVKIILTLALLGGVVIVGTIYYQFNKPRENVGKARTDFRISVKELVTSFLANESQANEKFLGKILEVDGKVIQLIEEEGSRGILLESSTGTVYCACEQIPEIKIGTMVLVKGKCSGYLMDVVLNDCELIKQNLNED